MAGDLDLFPSPPSPAQLVLSQERSYPGQAQAFASSPCHWGNDHAGSWALGCVLVMDPGYE